MRDAIRLLLTTDLDVLIREVLGLAVICSAIIAMFCLPAQY
ncbi:hypothetical protein [Amaricoccus sp. B4]